MAEELNNPLFEDEREFLERKKQEYERALRGDVEHIKEQGVQVGKVAAVGAGLLGSVWLISKAFGGKSKRKKNKKQKQSHDELISLPNQDDELIGLPGGYGYDSHDHDDERDTRYGFDDDNEFELDDDAFALDRSAEFRAGDDDRASNNTDYYPQDDDSSDAYSARESARAFMAHDDQRPDAYDHNDDLDREEAGDEDFDNAFNGRKADDDLPQGRLDFGPTMHYHKQGYQPAAQPDQPLAYDDSRRLPESDEFSAAEAADKRSQPAAHNADVPWPSRLAGRENASPLSKRVSGMVLSFLGTDTGKAVAAQATAVALAYASKKINDYLPKYATAKNADLADAPATTTFHTPPSQPAASSTAVSLTYTDAPTEHPAS